ncbi:MAG: ABC transporter permease subunit [Alphaproteobacteria bacterium]
MTPADRLMRATLVVYLAIFFAYLFLPLGFMMVAAFNDYRFPMVTPWRGTTLKWFADLGNDPLLWDALGTSVVIGIVVVAISLPLGLAGALTLSRIAQRSRNLTYAVLVSPVLTPGIVIGISTILLWDQAFGLTGNWFIASFAQASFISAYAMLLFLARLQRFDPALEEAALDLGATPAQVFRRITVPFLMPAILAAAALAFMQSFENYNTTLFSIGIDQTLTIYIATKVRQALTPAINALAVVMIALSIAGAVAVEIAQRREARRAAERRARAAIAELAPA